MQRMLANTQTDVKQDSWCTPLYTNAHKHPLPTWKTLVHSADISSLSLPAVCPLGHTFLSLLLSATLSAEPLSCRFTNGATETGSIKLDGRLWGWVTFLLHQSLQQRNEQKLIWSHIWLHLFHTWFGLRWFIHNRIGYTLPPLLSKRQLRTIQKTSREGPK